MGPFGASGSRSRIGPRRSPAAADRPSLRETGPLTAPTEASLADLPVGPFATVDRTAVPLSADEGRPLDEAGAWLDLDPGTGRRPRSFVATAYLPRATGLGVALSRPLRRGLGDARAARPGTAG